MRMPQVVFNVDMERVVMELYVEVFITDALARGSLRQQTHQVRAAREAPTMH